MNKNEIGTLGKWDSILNYIVKTIQWVGHAKVSELAKIISFFTIVILLSDVGWWAYKIGNDQNTLNKMLNEIVRKEKEDEANMKIRDAVTPRINNELKKILYTSNASRVAIFELHNGKENATNLPFRYVDMSYEAINENDKDINFVSDRFQNIPLTHYQMPYYVAKNGMFIGTTEDARMIDSRFAGIVDSIGGKYISSVILKSGGRTIGFLCLFFDKNLPLRNKPEMKQTLEKLADIVSPLLDLKVLKLEKDRYKTW